MTVAVIILVLQQVKNYFQLYTYTLWNLCDSMLTAIPSFGLLVNRNLTFHIFLSGLPLPTSHSLYDFKLYDNDAIFINILLAAIENFKLCEGFTESGKNVTIPVLYKAYPNSSLTELQIR